MKSRSHQRMSFQVPQANTKGKTCSRKYHIVTHEDKGCKDSQKVSVRLLKRASPYSSTVLEAYTGNIQTAKAVEKEGKRQRLHSHTFQEKVDAVAYPGEILSEKYTNENDSDDDACSVGSCSVNSWKDNRRRIALIIWNRKSKMWKLQSATGLYSWNIKFEGWIGHIWKHDSLLPKL